MIENPKIVALLNNIGAKENIKDYMLILYGNLNQEIIVSTLKLIERKLIFANFSTTIVTRTKLICVEMLQNIIKHQENHESFLPYFIVGANDKNLNILCGNAISKEARDVIEIKLVEYSSINKSGFREYYIEAFNNSLLSEKGNAGLGLLDIYYRSMQNVSYEINSLTKDLYAFNLDVMISE